VFVYFGGTVALSNEELRRIRIRAEDDAKKARDRHLFLLHFLGIEPTEELLLILAYIAAEDNWNSAKKELFPGDPDV